MRKAMGARTGLHQDVLKAPGCGQRCVMDFEGSWATAWSWDKLGPQHYSPSQGSGRQGTPLELQGGGQTQVLGGEVAVELP